MIDIDPKYKPENSIKKWVPLHKKKFNQWVFSKFKYDNESDESLFIQQRVVKDFMQPNSPYRGLMLYHGLGVGKTAASIVAAEGYINKGIVVMLPASLRQNYIGEIQRYGNELFSLNQHWKFVTASDVKKKMLKAVGLNEAKYRMTNKAGDKFKGLWVTDSTLESNYSKLSVVNQKYIQKQLKDTIEHFYKFIHYNGVTKNALIEMTDNNNVNPFDDKFIIIDEVHNFISRIVNKSKISTTIYNLLLSAKNAKLVLLSGTPLINYPHEISYIANLLRGNITYYKIAYKKYKDYDSVIEYLDTHPHVEHYYLENNNVCIQLVPNRFYYKQNDKKSLSIQEEEIDSDDIMENIRAGLKNKGMQFKNDEDIQTISYDLLPTNEDIFNEYFIDFKDTLVKNSNMLSRRLQGLFSYYHAYPKDLYPSSSPINVVRLNMSDLQFTKYGIERSKEMEYARKAAKYAKVKKDSDNVFKNNGNVYRCFSRSICNFVFPESIKRPYPSSIKRFKQEMDDVDQEIGNDEEYSDEEATTYQGLIDITLKKMRDNSDKYLKLENLHQYSPKFHSIIEKINSCPGTCLVYSQFRTVEGLGLLSIAFDTNGYEELKLFKKSDGDWDINIDQLDPQKSRYIYFNSDPEYIQIALNIFNSHFERLPKNILKKIEKTLLDIADKNLHGQVAKIILITQSGSEGISLKNVRQVHILEPYWNNIRLNQVIGRAVRANSHIDLPENERTVESFLYLAKFNDLQSTGTPMETYDGNITSDEYIYDIALKKSNIMSKLYDIVKNVSFDCELHKTVHENAKCYTSELKDENVYSHDIRLDVKDTNVKRVVTSRSIELKIVKFPDGKRFALDKSTGLLYDVDKSIANILEVVGKLRRDENNKPIYILNAV